MVRDLHQFLNILRQERELVTIAAEVDPYLEVAEIHRRVIAAGGKALLFTRVKGADFPVVTNLFGTERRLNLAFGTKPERVVATLANLAHSPMPPPLSTLWRSREALGALTRLGTKRVSRHPLTGCDRPARLSRLPILTTWIEDGGPFVTQPLVYTQHPDTKVPNLGMYRMQRFDDTTAGFHAQIGKGGGFHLAVAEERGERLPVNVFLGGPPALTLAAIAPLPENVPELLLASLVMDGKVPLAANEMGPLPLLASSEFTIVGEIPPGVRRPEGPFGDHYGYYSLRHDYPVIEVKAVYHRADAILPATVVGPGRQEDAFIGDYLQKLMSPIFPVVMPTVRDLWAYRETGYHSLAAAVIRERYGRESLVSAFRILGEGQLSLTKFLLLTDRPQDLTNFRVLLSSILERADLRSDLCIFGNTSLDTLDYAGPEVNRGSKGVLVGTGAPRRTLPNEFSGELPQGISSASVFCPGCLVIEGTSWSDDKELPTRLVDASALSPWPLVVLTDRGANAAASQENFLWTTFTRFEPAADIHGRNPRIIRHHVGFDAPIVIDARMKSQYPAILTCDSQTKALVDRRWSEYGISL